jgi:hypothetical protein
MSFDWSQYFDVSRELADRLEMLLCLFKRLAFAHLLVEPTMRSLARHATTYADMIMFGRYVSTRMANV